MNAFVLCHFLYLIDAFADVSFESWDKTFGRFFTG